MSIKTCKEALGNSLYHKLRFEDGLPIKWIRFIAVYLINDFNATDAYMRTVARKGSKREACAAQAHHLINNNKIQQAIKVVMDKWLGEKKLKLESKIIKTLYHRAFYDPFMFINPDGTIKFSKAEEIDEEWRCVVDGIEQKYHGKDAEKETVTIKLANKEQAMRELSRYIQLYKEAESATGSLSEDTVNKLLDVFQRKQEKSDADK